MKVFVTGAGGFLGSAVVDALIDRGHHVTAMVRTVPSLCAEAQAKPASRVSYIEGDLRHRAAWCDAAAQSEVVVHLAASFGDFDEQFAVNVVGTANLLAAIDGAESVKRFVHVSTFSVYDYYGLSVGAEISERSLLEAVPAERDAYAQTKIVQEQLVRDTAAAANLQLVVLRPGAIFGPGRLWNGGTALNLGGVAVAVAPRGLMKLTYVKNCADAVALAVDAPAAAGETINIVDDDLPTQREFQRGLAARRLPAPRRVVPLPYRAMRAATDLLGYANRKGFGGRARLPGVFISRRMDSQFKPLRYTNAKAKHVLGWTPRFNWRAALDDIASA